MTTITASRGAFARAMNIGATIIERTGVPIVQNVLVSVARGRAQLLFTDTEMWLSRGLDASADAITDTTLPAAALARAAQDMEGDTITLDVDHPAGRAIVRAGRSRLRLSMLRADQFPRLEDGRAWADAAAVEAAQLARAIERVSYAAVTAFGLNIQGIHFNAAVAGDLDLAAFDGKRAGIDFVENKGHALDPFNLPLKAARTLARLCAERPEAQVEFFATDRLGYFRSSEWELRSKLIEGRFAPYRSIVDAEAEHPALVDRAWLERAIGRLSLAADKKTNTVVFALSEERLVLSLEGQSADATEEIPVDYVGPPRTIGYNFLLLRDAVRHATGSEIAIAIDARLSATIRSANEAADSSIHSLAHMLIKETAHGS